MSLRRFFYTLQGISFGESLLLDSYPSLAAYGTRLLRIDYSGNAIKVRRSSDSEETDIPFNTDGTLNTSKLLTFADGGDAFITTWYDQSGNSHDVIQNTASGQPQIVDSGVIHLINGVPSLYADATNSLSTVATDIAVNDADGESSVFAVFNNEEDSATQLILSYIDGGTNLSYPIGLNNNNELRLNVLSYTGDTIAYTPGDTAIASAITQELVATMYKNGASDGSGVIVATTGESQITLFGRTSSLSTFKGYISEVVIYAEDKTSDLTGINSNLNIGHNVYWDGTQTGTMDAHSPSAAFSLKALFSDYTGPLIRIRRASDNDELDIKARYDGSLDTVSIEKFCAGTNGFVATWYDQSGNVNHAEQGTASLQPQIATSGVVKVYNGQACLDFDISECNLVLDTSIPDVLNMFAVVTPIEQNTLNYITYGSSTGWFSGGSSGSATGAGVFDGSVKSITSDEYGRHTYYYYNDNVNHFSSVNAEDNTDMALSSNLTIDRLSRNNSATYFRGVMQEVIIFDTDVSDSKDTIIDIQNQAWDVFWDGTVESFLDSDDGTGAEAAHSLKALSSSYTGNGLLVRRTSDNVELGIPYTYTGLIDTFTLESFCDGTDGHVVTWYDQSGNSHDVTQATAGDQPQIVDTGVVHTAQGLPVIDFVTDSLSKGSGNSLSYDSNLLSVFMSLYDINTTSGKRIACDDITGTQGYWTLENQQLTINDGTGYKTVTTTAYAKRHEYSSFCIDSDGLVTMITAGATTTDTITFDGTIGASGTAGYAIGDSADGASTPLIGQMQEIIVYGSDKTSVQAAINTARNSEWNCHWDGSQEGILDSDDYGSDIKTAYSVRALSSSYVGPLLRVRRGSDNAEVDIFANHDGTLDVSTLELHCASTNGFVTTWYDQSGAGNDASLGTAAAQPQIISSGSVITESDGRPAVTFDGANDRLALDAYPFASTESNITIVTVVNVQNTDSNLFLLSDSGNDLVAVTYSKDAADTYDFNYYTDSGSVDRHAGGDVIDGRHVQLFIHNAGTSAISAFTDSVEGEDTYSVRGVFNANTIGARENNYELEGTIQEMLFFEEDLSSFREEIEDNITEYFNLY